MINVFDLGAALHKIVNFRIDAEQKLGALYTPMSGPTTCVIRYKTECFRYSTTHQLGKGEACVFLALVFSFIII